MSDSPADRSTPPDLVSTNGAVGGSHEKETGADDARAQAERILKRNRELVSGIVEGSVSGEDAVAGSHTLQSDRSHAGGDYSSD